MLVVGVMLAVTLLQHVLGLLHCASVSLNHEVSDCRSTETQVDPSSALKRTKHHQSDPSNIPRILSSS